MASLVSRWRERQEEPAPDSGWYPDLLDFVPLEERDPLAAAIHRAAWEAPLPLGSLVIRTARLVVPEVLWPSCLRPGNLGREVRLWRYARAAVHWEGRGWEGLL